MTALSFPATYELLDRARYSLPVWTLFPWCEDDRLGWLSWN